MINSSFKKLLPNFLTILRIILTPICLYFLFIDIVIIAFILFLIASFTDFLDGYFARKYNSISKLGAFIDPIADKMLVVGLFISFYILNIIIDEYILFMGIFRDVFVTILRILMQSNGSVMITSKISKLKTAFQFLVITLLFLKIILFINSGDLILYCIALVSAILTFYTGIHYLRNNFNQLLQSIKN